MQDRWLSCLDKINKQNGTVYNCLILILVSLGKDWYFTNQYSNYENNLWFPQSFASTVLYVLLLCSQLQSRWGLCTKQIMMRDAFRFNSICIYIFISEFHRHRLSKVYKVIISGRRLMAWFIVYALHPFYLINRVSTSHGSQEFNKL